MVVGPEGLGYFISNKVELNQEIVIFSKLTLLKYIFFTKGLQVNNFSLKILAFVCLYLCNYVVAGTQHQYYVSPTGNDNNSGSQGSPFATLHKAKSAVRSVNATMTGDVVINLTEGTHKLDSTLNLTSFDKGTNGFNIIYQGSTTGTTIVSGGRRITGWALHDVTKNIYKATADSGIDTRQLYVNGVRAIRARSADASGWSLSVSDTGKYTCPAGVASWKNITNVEVVSFWEWTSGRGPIESVSGTLATVAKPYWTNRRVNEQPVWIENAYELLDSEGEWYLDKPLQTLYYKPRTGESMSTAEVILPVLETLVNGANLSHVQFRNITFSHATWLEPNSGKGIAIEQADVLRGSTCILPNVKFTNCDYLIFEKNIFTHLGGTGLKLGDACHNNVVYDNTFTDISASGIALGHLPDFNASLNAKNNIINNNHIYDVAKEYKASVGILVGYTEATRVTRNEIRNLPYTGISAGWGWNNTIESGKNNEIAYNRIDNVMRVLHDGGAIYTLSNQPGAQVHHNYISNVLHAEGTGSSSVGLYPDEGSSHMNWHHNVIDNVDRWAHLWTYTITDDTVSNNFTNTNEERFDGTNTVKNNNTYVAGTSWPQTALDIMKSAGRNGVLDPKFTNLAMNKSSTSSSNWSGFSSAAGNDGNIGTLWASDNIEKLPWIQIDLGAQTEFDSIVIIARQDLDQQGVRTNFEIRASNSVDFSTSTILGGNYASKGDLPFPAYDSWTLKLATKVLFQYIRVQRVADAGHFNFAEVMVFASSKKAVSDLSNLAMFKQESHSSAWDDYRGYWGNDGNSNTIWASDGEQKTPYFQINLEKSTGFDSIVIIGRQDQDQPGIRTDFEIQGSNSADFSEKAILGGNYAAKGDTPYSYKGSWSLKLAKIANFQYVRVQRVADGGHFNFAEVELFMTKTEDNPVSARIAIAKRCGVTISCVPGAIIVQGLQKTDKLNVYTLAGKLVVSTNRSTIATRGLSRGLYLISISGSQITTKTMSIVR